MPTYDFDFQRYVARRKGAREAEAREGAAYAYAGDLKVLRTLDRLRPVTLAVEATVRLWRSSARAALLGTAVRTSDKHFPRVHQAAERAGNALHVAAPACFVSPHLAHVSAFTFGTDDDAALVLDAALVEALDDSQLVHVIGGELGHVQNGHVPFRTALYYLVHSASDFARWIVKPAVAALGAWSRRADVTADRAAILCTRESDLAIAAGALAHLALADATERRDGDVADLAAAIQGAAAGPAEVSPLLAAHPTLPRRLAALRVFVDSAYYRGVVGQTGGYPQETCDSRVAEILSQGA